MDLSDSGVIRGPIKESRLPSPCPLCGLSNVVMRSVPLDLPYFGEAFQTTLRCEDCGFRHADLMLTRTAEPRRVTLAISQLELLNVRVARSSSGTIRIPELGARMDPGPRSEAFVSNVEGVLHRFRDVSKTAMALATTKKGRERAERALARIEECIGGRRAFTLILEDPTGNSDIVHTDTIRERLKPEEIVGLRTSEVSVDVQDLARAESRHPE